MNRSWRCVMDICPNALYNKLEEDLTRFESFAGLDMPSPDATYHEFAADAIRRSLLKKYINNVSPDADAKALDKFLQADAMCAAWQEAPEDSRDEVLLGEFRRAVYDFWYDRQITPLVSHAFDILDHARMGPGSSLLVKNNDLYSKLFSSCLTTTKPSLYVTYRAYLEESETWSCAEVRRTEEFGLFQYSPSSLLGFVPKNDNISRTICTEPSLNMFYQLGFGQILSRRLKRVYGIDLSRQPDKNREMARIGSLNDEMSTIDLSSASDTISMKMVEATFPRGFVTWLKYLRSPSVILPDGRTHVLSMLSSMGNGFTFPLETLIFSCVVLSAFRFHGIQPMNPYGNNLGNWACFGDDIIVPRVIERTVIRLLSLLGFKVNPEKSFFEGPFRESCGADYFRGQPVRGVFLKALDTTEDFNKAINLLLLWSSRTGIDLPRTVRYLKKRMRINAVPIDAPIDSGIRFPYKYAVDHKSTHFNANFSLKYHSRQIRQYRVQVGEPRDRYYIRNPEGLLTCILAGVIRPGEYVVVRQQSAPKYSTKLRVCPNWDSLEAWPRRSVLNPNSQVTDLARFTRAFEAVML